MLDDCIAVEDELQLLLIVDVEAEEESFKTEEEEFIVEEEFFVIIDVDDDDVIEELFTEDEDNVLLLICIDVFCCVIACFSCSDDVLRELLICIESIVEVVVAFLATTVLLFCGSSCRCDSGLLGFFGRVMASDSHDAYLLAVLLVGAFRVTWVVSLLSEAPLSLMVSL